MSFLSIYAFKELKRATIGEYAYDPRADMPAYATPEEKAQARRILSEWHDARFQYASFVGWTLKPVAGTTVTVDAAGFRQHPAGPNRVESPRRVDMFGGSTVWGTGADDANTIPALLEYSEPRLKVFNRGESAYTSRHNLARLVNLVTAGEVLETVVFYDGVNDVYHNCRAASDINQDAQEDRMRRLLADPADDKGLGWLAGRLAYKVFLVHTASALQRLSVRFVKAGDMEGQGDAFNCDDDPAKARRVARAWLENWKIARQIVTSRGGNFIGIVQPVAGIGAARVDYLDLSDEVVKQYRAVYPLFLEMLRAEGGTWFHDFTDAYDRIDSPPLYIDFCHVTWRGNLIIARRLNALVSKF